MLLIYFLLMFAFPEGPPINISIIPAYSSSILIHWFPPLLPNGIIKWYDLYINYTNNSDITRVIVNGDYNIYFLDDLHDYIPTSGCEYFSLY